jgi:tetratricopeptide (TPR) repeat protein
MRVLVAIALVLAATPAAADDKARAKHLYDDGLAHYNVGEYAAAIESWKQAYVIQPKPILLFNIGQAYRLSGDCAQATTFYDRYASDAPPGFDQDELDHARALCPVTTKPVEPAVVDTKPAPIVTTPPPIGAAPPPPSHRQRTAGIVVGAAGLAIDAAAIFFAIDSASQNHTLDHFTGEWTQAQEDIQKRGRRDVVLAYALGAGGTAALITGAVLFVLDRSSDEHAVSVTPLRGGASLVWARPF